MLLIENIWVAGPETIKVITSCRVYGNKVMTAAVEDDISCKIPKDAVDDCGC